MAVNNSLANRQRRMGLTAYLTQDAVKDQINKVVGGKNGTRFISSIVSAVQTNPGLQECTNSSILSAALLGESLNLSPSPQLGQYYMVPYDNRSKGEKEAQFQLGYKGYIQLATRSGQYKKLTVVAIKEGELIRFDPLNEEIEVHLIEDEDERENTPTMVITLCLSIQMVSVRLCTGAGKRWRTMPRNTVLDIRRIWGMGRSGHSGPRILMGWPTRPCSGS